MSIFCAIHCPEQPLVKSGAQGAHARPQRLKRAIARAHHVRTRSVARLRHILIIC